MSKAVRGKLQAIQKQMAQEAEKDLPSMYRTANVHNCFKQFTVTINNCIVDTS